MTSGDLETRIEALEDALREAGAGTDPHLEERVTRLERIVEGRIGKGGLKGRLKELEEEVGEIKELIDEIEQGAR